MTSILFLIETIYRNIFRCNYLRDEIYFRNFFWHFLNLDLILKIFKKKMRGIADAFFNIRTPKNVVTKMSKKSYFRGYFDKWQGKWDETLLKSERQHLYYIYWSPWRQFSRKNCLLVICKILGLFVKPFTANDKYSLLNRGNLQQHFQMQSSQKRKIISKVSFSTF